MKGWKVLNRYRESAIHSIHFVTYPKGVEVKPTLKGSKLFFFDKKKDACYFARINCQAWIVVPCIAKGVSKPKWISLTKDDCVINFWKLRSKVDKCELTPALKGTRFADSITCLE